MLESLLLLLLPLAAASGWLAARRSYAKRENRSPQDLSPAYFRGLNFLLNEQPDKAIDVFIEMLKVDSDTVETHLALGNLFRRRGEVDRAIRIHQNLIAWPTLNQEQRAQALLELGQDYMRAGLFDRAEDLFVELAETGVYVEQAHANLLVIYQQEKDWKRCLEIAQQNDSENHSEYKQQIAHYYCELAQIELDSLNLEEAEAYIEKAQAMDKKCVRATILQGQMQQSRGDLKGAMQSFKLVEQQDPIFLSEVLNSLVVCFQALGRQDELTQYLSALYTRYRYPRIMLALTDILLEQEGAEAAIDFVHDYLSGDPDLEALDRLIKLNLQREDRQPREILELLNQAVEKLLNAKPAYQCDHCGFVAKHLHWCCPSCRSWASIKPVQGLSHCDSNH